LGIKVFLVEIDVKIYFLLHMKSLIISVLIGLFIGTLDVIPMVIQKLNKRACLSAFLQYFFVSIIIVNINIPVIPWWLEGALISSTLSLPVIVIISEKDKKAVPIILGMSVVLGTIIGIAGHFLIP
jgi:hypothetical protein